MTEITKSADKKPADFEEAINATGFGKFNILLLLAVIPPAFAQVFETNALAYVFPIAQCDLGLTLEDKGLLNAITYAGMITSGFLWGYLCDTAGRRRIIIIGYFLTGSFAIVSSISQNIIMLITAKFLAGFIINGPFAATISYLSEFHATQYRARIQIVRGTLLTVAMIVLPLIAWSILQRQLSFTFSNFNIHAWNMFLFVCALIPIVAGVIFIFMPESPKFLMSHGRNEEALVVFQKVYKLNTGQPTTNFPIKALTNEKANHEFQIKGAKVEKKLQEKPVSMVFRNIKSLFSSPNVSKLVLVCLNNFIMMVGINSFQLWLPQLLQSISDYELHHNFSNPTVCQMFDELIQDNKATAEANCGVNLDNASVYVNSAILGMAQVLGFIAAGIVVNYLGKKRLIFIAAFVSSCSSVAIYFAQSANMLVILSAIFLAFGNVAGNILVTVTLEIFPTTLRTMALSMHSACGRMGSLFGNLIFPVLLYSGCAMPFIFIGGFSLGCALLTCLYPNTDNKALK